MLVFACVLRQAVAENLIRNPGFEQVKDSRTLHWATEGFNWYAQPKELGLSRVEIDEAVLQGPGHRSLKLVGAKNRGMARQVLRYKPNWGTRFQLSGWMKFQGFKGTTATIAVEFVGEGNKWLGIKNCVTDWRQQASDWKSYGFEFQCPANTKHIIVFCGTQKPNSGTVWFDNVSLFPLQPKAVSQAPVPRKAEIVEKPVREPDALIPIDTFENGVIKWGGQAWAEAKGAEISIGAEEAAVGSKCLRVKFVSPKNNWMTRRWNYTGKWSAVSFMARRISDQGKFTFYLQCGRTVFYAVRVAPSAQWKKFSAFLPNIRYAWGPGTKEEKNFDPSKVTGLGIAHDGLIEFEIDHIALDAEDVLSVRSAYTEQRANLFSPGERPIIKTDLLNAWRTLKSGTLAIDVRDIHGRSHHRISRNVELPSRTYSSFAFQLPPLEMGYFTASVQLESEGRMMGKWPVGLCMLPQPERDTRAFMGASAFGMTSWNADIGRRIGVRAAEFLVSWQDCEPERGKFKFEYLESTLVTFERLGMQSTAMIRLQPGHFPAWASAAKNPSDRSRYFANDPEDIGNFVETLVHRLKDRVHHWSLFGEVDLMKHHWKRGLEGYVEACRAACEGAKRADPDCIIGGIGVSGVDAAGKNPRFPVARELWGRLGTHLDGFFFDGYANARRFGPGLHTESPEENNLEGMLKDALKLVRRSGQDKRIAIEEKGWCIDERLPLDHPLAASMAGYLARSYIIARAQEGMDYYMWFQLCVPGSADNDGYSYSLFQFEGDRMNPRPAAAAYAFVANFLAGVEDSRRVGIHKDLYAYAFARGKGSRAALWTPLDDPVSFEVDLPSTTRVTDMMGVPLGIKPGRKQRLEISTSPLYLWDEKLTARQLEARLRKASFRLPCASLAVSMQRRDELRIHVRSLLSRSIKGHLEVSVPDGWEIESAKQKLRLTGRAKDVIKLRLIQAPWPLPLRPGEFLVRFRSRNLGEVRASSSPKFHRVRRMQVAPKIDADLSEYEPLPEIRLDGQSFLSPPDAVANKLWTGREDLSVKAWVGWDDNKFYFAAIVRDETFEQKLAGTGMWANDSFQLAFDPLNNALGSSFDAQRGYGADDSEFGIALTPQGPQTWQWIGGPGGQERDLSQASLAVKRSHNETIYEWALPWTEVAFMEPEVGMIFGFNFVALDTDRTGRALYWMGLTEGICGGKDPSIFNKFVLEE